MDTAVAASLVDPAAPGASPAERKFARAAWFMVFAAMLGTMCCSTSVVLVNTGVFMKPLASAFSWSRGELSLSLSIAALSMAAANPFVGRLIDLYGVRPVLIASLIGYGAVTAAVPLFVQVGGLWGLYASYVLIAAIGAGSNVIAYVRILSGWFIGPLDRYRGLALGVSSAGVPLGGAISAPLGVLLISHFGWRGGFWGLSLLPICIGLPVALLGIRMAPGETGGARAAKAAGQPEATGATLAEAAHTRAFWLLVVAVLLMASCLQGITIHTAPLLSDRGLKPDALAMVLGIGGLLGIVGRVGAGQLFDRFFAPWVSVGIFGLGAASAFALAGIPGLFIAVAATLLVTVGTGAESDFVGFVVGRYFGLKAYAQIFGVIYGMFMVGIAVGPFLFGLAFDHFGDYRIPFLIAGLGLTLLCGLLLLLPRFEAVSGKT